MSIGAGAIRAGLAVVELSADLGPLDAALNQAATRFKGWSGRLTRMGAGMAALGTSIAGPILAAFHNAVSQAASMDTLATQLGLTTEKASALTYALGTVGIEEAELVGFTRHLNSAFASAADGSNEAVQGFARLGLNWQELAKMPLDERLLAVKEALGQITNDFDRSTQAAHYFGRRGQELLKLSTEQLRRRMGEAGEVGAVVSPEQAAQAKEIQRSWTQMGSAIKFAFLEVGRALLPHADQIREYSRYVVTTARTVRQWISENKTLVVGVLAVGAALTAGGAALVALGVVGASIAGVFSGIAAAGTAVIGVVGGIGAAIASGAIVPMLGAIAIGMAWAVVVVSALAVVAGGIALLVIHWDDVKAAAQRAWLGIVTFTLSAWEKIKQTAERAYESVLSRWYRFVPQLRSVFAAVGVVAAQAWELLAQTASSAWGTVTRITAQAVGDGAVAWGTIRDTAKEAWGGVVSAVKRGDFQGAWSIVVAGSAVAWQSVKMAFLNTWDSIVQAAMDGWGALVAYLDVSFSGALAGIVSTFTAALAQMLGNLAERMAAIANSPAARAAGISGRLGGLAETLGAAGQAVGQQGAGAGAWAQRRQAAAEEELERAKEARAAAVAENRDKREAAVEEARAKLKAILDEEKDKEAERKKGGGGAGAEEAAGVGSGGLQQAAREVRGSFGGGFSGSASAQQALAIGSTPVQRQLVESQKQTNLLEQIRDKIEEPAFG